MQIDGERHYQHAIEHNLVGLGYGLNGVDVPQSFVEFEQQAEDKYRGNRFWRSDVGTLENDIAKDDLIWIYDRNSAAYYIGRVTGDWRYSAEGPLYNVRDCEWHPVASDLVPGSVLHSRSTILELKGLSSYSKFVYNKVSASTFYTMQLDATMSLWSFLSPDEVEDAVALYLQSEPGYSILPSTCKHSTPDVEFIMLHRETGRSAGLQVKSRNATVDFDRLSGIKLEKIFSFSVVENPGVHGANTEPISPAEVESFLLSHIEQLPAVLRHWVKQKGQSLDRS